MEMGNHPPPLFPDMSAATFDLAFVGYWREINISGIPASTGVYGVYVCQFDEVKKTVALEKLIYVGQAVDARDRVAKHEKWPVWKQEIVHVGQLLCFNFAPVDAWNLDRVEGALIYQSKPVCNDQGKTQFDYESTTITASGRVTLVPEHFTVPMPTAYPRPGP